MPTKTVSSDIVLNPSGPITFGDYVDGVRIAAPYMKSLAATLANAAPADLDASGRRQLAVIAEIARHGDDVLDDRQGIGGIRPLLDDFVNAWGALHDGLAAKARLPATLSDRGGRASALLTDVFPDGVAFVRRDAHAAWSDGDRRLGLIVDEELEAGIEELLGEEHLDVVRKATAALGEALGVGRTKRERQGGTSLQDTLTRFSQEVARYARMMAAQVAVNDPASVARFRSAVADPIDALRSRRGANEDDVDGEPVDPQAPVVAPAPVTPA